MKLQLVAKYEKKLKGEPCEIVKNFRKKFEMRFLNSVTVPKNVKGGTVWDFFDIHCVANIETNEGETHWWNPKNFIKSRIVPKKIRVKNTKRGILCFRGSGRRCFCFGRGSGVSSMFWTSSIEVDDVEQMNKKVDRSR